MLGRVACALAAIAAGACSSAPASSSGDAAFPSDAYVTTASMSGALTVEVRTAPSQPPPRGTCDVELRVLDRAGHGIDGLAVSVVPWMPAMGHGASVVPTVTAEGDGRYRAQNVSLYMPGAWQLRVALSGEVNDDAVPVVQVP